MNISDLQHLEIVSEETQIQGQGGSYFSKHDYFKGSNKAVAFVDSSAIAEGHKTNAYTYGETNTFTNDHISASSSTGVSSSSSK